MKLLIFARSTLRFLFNSSFLFFSKPAAEEIIKIRQLNCCSIDSNRLWIVKFTKIKQFGYLKIYEGKNA